MIFNKIKTIMTLYVSYIKVKPYRLHS